MDFETFRDRSEAFWQTHVPRTLEQQVELGVGGSDWKTGTRWLPYRDDEIDAAEEREGRLFPAPYREFLSGLGRPDRPQIRFQFEGRQLSETEGRVFADWNDPVDIADRRADVVEGILFDVAHGIWLTSWGEAPEEEQKADHVRDLIAAAPPLLPLWSLRVVPSCVDAGPVLSIHQTDAICYGASIIDVLRSDFAMLIGEPRPEHAPVDVPAAYGFWHDLVDGNG